MPHKVEISDKTYEDLKEFCSLNNLKIGQFTDKLIRDGLMIEMYGDVPFTNYRKPAQEITTIEVKTECPKIDEETKLEALEELEKPIFLNPYINSASTVEIEKFCKKLTEDALKEIGIPDKVANKITKRRLK